MSVQKFNKKYWEPNEDLILIENYNKFKGLSHLKNLLPFTPRQIGARAHYLKLKKFIPLTKDELFFDVPNIINCAIAGMLAADGCMQKNRLTIGLAGKDQEYLEMLKKITKYTGKINTRTSRYKIKNYSNPSNPDYEGDYTVCLLGFNYIKKWKKDLEKYFNITSKKSLTLLPPNLNDLNLQLAYLSGIYDGDGNISMQKKKGKPMLGLHFIGTKELVEWAIKIYKNIFPNFKIKSVKRKSPNIFTLKINGCQSYILSKMILSMNLPRLERKWKIAEEFINTTENGLMSKDMLRILKQNITQQQVDFLAKYNSSFPPFLTSHLKSSNFISQSPDLNVNKREENFTI